MAQAGPVLLKMPRREREVTIPEYEGFTARLWVNYPKRLQNDLKSGDADKLRAALQQIVVSHNGWCDEAGEVLPQPSAPAFWDAIPDELAAALLALLVREENVLPNSILARSPR